MVNTDGDYRRSGEEFFPGLQKRRGPMMTGDDHGEHEE
jgi:hypothetical protein